MNTRGNNNKKKADNSYVRTLNPLACTMIRLFFNLPCCIFAEGRRKTTYLSQGQFAVVWVRSGLIISGQHQGLLPPPPSLDAPLVVVAAIRLAAAIQIYNYLFSYHCTTFSSCTCHLHLQTCISRLQDVGFFPSKCGQRYCEGLELRKGFGTPAASIIATNYDHSYL